MLFGLLTLIGRPILGRQHMSDQTRYADLRELFHAREGKPVREREAIEHIMHDIKKQDTRELNQIRQELIGSVRAGEGKTTKRLSEKIKHMTHQKGMEHRG